jgi:F-type H+-transporting ATPase subunit delta
MTPGAISRRYALALLNLAESGNQVEAAAQGLDDLAAALESSPRLKLLLVSPEVSQANKAQVLDSLMSRARVIPLLSKFVQFLLSKQRIAILGSVREVFNRLADERLGRAHAEITVAVPIGREQETRLLNMCEKLSGKQITLAVRVDPDILGGAIARIGSRVWDGSLRNALHIMHSAISRG